MTPAPPPADALRLDVCPGCAYQLEGLPPEGLCPECGRAYDQKTIILYGWAAGSKADAGNAKPWHAALLAAVPLAYCAAMIVRALRRGHEIRLVLFSGWAAVMIWLVWRRFTFRGPGLAQIRLSDAGCLQADSTEDADDDTPTPWAEVEAVTLDRLGGDGDGTYHLRLATRATWWGWGTAFVDAEVRCTDAQAAALRERIERWRNDALASAPTGTAAEQGAPGESDPDLAASR